MAKVEMDLSELDKIREDLKKANQNIDDKLMMLNKKDKEIAEIQADKRTVKVTIKKDLIKKEVSPYNFWINDRRCGEQNYQDFLRKELIRDIIRDYKERCYSDEVLCLKIKKYENQILSQNAEKWETKEIITTEYINFDDVQSELRTEIENKVGSELGSLRSQVSRLTSNLAEKEAKCKEEVENTNKKWNKILADDSRDAADKYAKLLKDYNNLVANKETKSLEEQIIDLKEQLKKEKAKKWYQKIF